MHIIYYNNLRIVDTKLPQQRGHPIETIIVHTGPLLAVLSHVQPFHKGSGQMTVVVWCSTCRDILSVRSTIIVTSLFECLLLQIVVPLSHHQSVMRSKHMLNTKP